MKPYKVTTYDYDRELHRTVIMNAETFNTEEEALQYAETIELGTDTRVIVSGDYGYTKIKEFKRN